MTQEFVDKRSRKWEYFIDYSYYNMTCVRLKSETDFNSNTSYHFDTYKQAMEFVELLKISSQGNQYEHLQKLHLFL